MILCNNIRVHTSSPALPGMKPHNLSIAACTFASVEFESTKCFRKLTTSSHALHSPLACTCNAFVCMWTGNETITIIIAGHFCWVSIFVVLFSLYATEHVITVAYYLDFRGVIPNTITKIKPNEKYLAIRYKLLQKFCICKHNSTIAGNFWFTIFSWLVK